MAYHLGTSGWSYPGWKGRFYPAELPSRDWLAFYANHFSTVEINMTFYRFPKPETLKSWLSRTPDHFTFTLKANRQITHQKKLHNVRGDVRYFYILANSLEARLGCILFQLPPSIKLDLVLLQDFLATLESRYRNVIEFRHPSWYEEKVYENLRRAGVAFCTVSSEQVPPTAVVTSSVAYFRFHGLTGGYRYNYSEDELAAWADTIKGAEAEETYVYFNNDYQAYAVRNCLKLRELLFSRDAP